MFELFLVALFDLYGYFVVFYCDVAVSPLVCDGCYLHLESCGAWVSFCGFFGVFEGQSGPFLLVCGCVCFCEHGVDVAYVFVVFEIGWVCGDSFFEIACREFHQVDLRFLVGLGCYEVEFSVEVEAGGVEGVVLGGLSEQAVALLRFAV